MQLVTHSFITGKSGASFEECEDAISLNAAARRYAVTDGATEAFAAGSWARALAANWAKKPLFDANNLASDFALWAQVVGESWQAEWDVREMSWFAATKRDAGSFAAFVGLEFANDLTWQACAIGDACLIIKQAEKIISAMPLDDAGEFNQTPFLLASRIERQANIVSQIVIESGAAQRGDVFMLLTDAAAAWYLRSSAEHSSIIAEFEGLLMNEDEAELKRLVCNERTSNRLRDDDVAVVQIEVK